MKLPRRHVLGAALATVVVGASGCALLPVIPKRPAPSLEHARGWLRVVSPGRVEWLCPRMEMGQGVHAALRVLIARELGLKPSQVRVRSPSTAESAVFKATVGSDSLRELTPLIRQACALLRPSLGLTVESPPGATLGDPVDPDLLALVTGKAMFTADVSLPGMVHATVLRGPWRVETGSTLQGLDDEALRRVPGFLQKLDGLSPDGPIVVADHPAALADLRRAAAARWSKPAGLSSALAMVDVDEAQRSGRITKRSGRVDEGAWPVDLRLDVPSAAHAGMEPRCAVARFNADGTLEVWCGTQDPFYVRDVLARDHGLSTSAVIVHPMRMGGAFGGRTIATVEREAAWAARAVGRPVKLQWSREDEFTGGFHRPPASHRVRLRMDSQGTITDWWHALSSSHVLFTNAALPPWMQRATDLIGDAGTSRGQEPPYAPTRERLDLTLTRLPIATGPWRGLGAGPNVLAIEAAMDAAARVAKQDPVAFRLKHLARAKSSEHLADPVRLAKALERVAQMAGWGVTGVAPVASSSGAPRRALGVACGVYKGLSMAAAVAEVELRDRALRVTRMWCVQDCGEVIDADGVRAQVEGNLVWSLGLVLSDNLAANEGSAAVASLADYALPTMRDMPAIDIELTDSKAPPAGAGETAIVAGAGAIFNAVVALTGSTPKTLPVRWFA
jgi:isoquinoline 1-oxidoreductase subunit beta